MDNEQLQKAKYHLWTFAISKFVATFGNSIYTFGISLYVLALTGSAISFALNLICSILPRTVLSPFAGYIIDRYSKKTIVISSQTISILIVSSLLLYSAFVDLTLLAVYISTSLLSISSMFTGLALTSSITQLIDTDRIQKAMGFNQIAVSFSLIGGPIIGGIMFGFIPIQAFLAIHIASFFIAIILEATMDFNLFFKIDPHKSSQEKILQGISSAFSYIRKQEVIWLLFWIALIINFFSVSIVVGLPYIIIEKLKIQSEHFGIIEGTFALGMLLGGLYFSISKELKFPLITSKRGILVISVLIAGTTVPVLANFKYEFNVVYYICIALLYGFTLAIVNTPIGVMLQKNIDEQYKGRVFGILETMAQAISPMGMILYGLLLDLIGPVWTILPTSIFLFVTIIYLLRSVVINMIYPEYTGIILGKIKRYLDV